MYNRDLKLQCELPYLYTHTTHYTHMLQHKILITNIYNISYTIHHRQVNASSVSADLLSLHQLVLSQVEQVREGGGQFIQPDFPYKVACEKDET